MSNRSKKTGEIEHANPRFLAKQVLDKPLVEVSARVRPGMQYMLDTVRENLWSEFVVPYVQPDGSVMQAPPEECMFLQALRRENADLWSMVQAQMMENGHAQKMRDDQVSKCKSMSPLVFGGALEKRIWRRLGVQAGVLPVIEASLLELSEAEVQ